MIVMMLVMVPNAQDFHLQGRAIVRNRAPGLRRIVARGYGGSCRPREQFAEDLACTSF